MKILILSFDDVNFLQWMYAEHPALENQTYEAQMAVREETLTDVAHFFCDNLRQIGHEAECIYVNNEHMQKTWLMENGNGVQDPGLLSRAFQETIHQMRAAAARTPLRHLKRQAGPVFDVIDRKRANSYRTIASQIQQYQPDILYVLAMNQISTRFLREMRPHAKLVVGQIAAPIPDGEDFDCYDLIISSLPNYVERFRGWGLRAELHRLAFESKVLDYLNKAERKIPVSFVGGFLTPHSSRNQLLEYLSSKTDVRMWGYGVDSLPSSSAIRKSYLGGAWGIKMFQVLNDSKITLNHHINIAESYANNRRLFEATGVGTLLVTDQKENLHEMFEPDKEVVTYDSLEECFEKVRYCLDHENERETIARAGQERTLREHTYQQRVPELIGLLKKYL